MNAMSLRAKPGSQAPKKKKALLFALAWAAAACVSSTAARAEWLLSPALSLESQHSSNFQLFIEDELEDSLIANTLTASLGINKETESVQFTGQAELGYSTYSGSRILDDIDRQYLDLKVRKRLTRGALGAAFSVRRDNLLRFVNSLTDFEGDIVDSDDQLDQTLLDPNSSINLTTEQIGRTVFSYRAFSKYRLSERNSIQLDYSFVNRQIDSADTPVNIAFAPRDTKRHSVGFQFSRSISERAKVSWDSSASGVDTANLGRVYIYESTVGWSSRLSEKTLVTASFGLNATGSAPNNKTGLAARAKLSHEVSWGTVDVQASRSLRPTIFGNVAESDSLRFSYRRPLTPKWSFGLDASGSQLSRSTNALVDIETKLLSTQPSLTWTFAPDWQLTAGYGFRWVDRARGSTSGTGRDHAATLSLNYVPAGIRL